MTKTENRLSFKVTKKHGEGKEEKLELAIVSADWDAQLDAQDKYNVSFKRSCDNEALLRPKLDNFLKDQGVWTPEREAELTSKQKHLQDMLYKMSKGRMTFEALVELTWDIKEARRDANEVAGIRDQYSGNTAEGQAENMRFACLLAASVVYDKTGERYWPTVDDYLAEAGSELAGVAAEKYAVMLIGSSEVPGADLPENRLLMKLGLMDDKCNYVREDGKKYTAHKLDDSVKWTIILINDKGRYVNEQGEYIDAYNRLVDEAGDYLNDDAVWLDKNGNPVPVVEETEKVKASEPVTA